MVGMVTLSCFLLVDENAPSGMQYDPERIVDLAVRYNAGPGQKIRIYKNFQEIVYDVKVEDHVLKRQAYIKGECIPYDVMDVIVGYGYCCYRDAVYFFNQNTRDEISTFYLSNDLQSVIRIARTMVPTRLGADGMRALSIYVSEKTREHSVVEFKGKLYAYQQKGLTWLLGRYKDFSGALLADDMGLGKTAQVIAFIVESIKNSTLNVTAQVVSRSRYF